MKDIKPVDTEKYFFHNLVEVILVTIVWNFWTNNDGTFQNFQTMAIVTQDTKPPIFESSSPLQVERFWFRLECKNWEILYSREKMRCNIVEIQY